MTTTAAAAERLRAGKYGMPIFDPTHFLSRQMMQDLATIRDAYLAEHPADDATPADAKWFRQMGAVRPMAPVGDEVLVIGLWFKDQYPLTYRNGKWFVYGADWINSPTRGDVRALARVLGIPLTGDVQ